MARRLAVYTISAPGVTGRALSALNMARKPRKRWDASVVISRDAACGTLAKAEEIGARGRDAPPCATAGSLDWRRWR
jgi:hypothetical protein